MRIVAEKASQNKHHYRSAKSVLSIAETRLRNSKVGKFVEVWTTGEKGNIQLHWRVKKEKLIATMRQDGRYLLVTNDPHLTPKQMLTVYRQKDGVEKRFTVSKQDLEVSPIYLHKDDRIKAMLLINMPLVLRPKDSGLALLTYSILERQMRQHGLQMTTRRLIEQLGELSIIETHCWDGSVTMRPTPITPEQMQLVRMMETILQTPFTRVAELARIDGPLPLPPLLPSPSQPG